LSAALSGKCISLQIDADLDIIAAKSGYQLDTLPTEA
jgi:hypothetical protein